MQRGQGEKTVPKAAAAARHKEVARAVARTVAWRGATMAAKSAYTIWQRHEISKRLEAIKDALSAEDHTKVIQVARRMLQLSRILDIEPALSGYMQFRIAYSSERLARDIRPTDPETAMEHENDAYDAFQTFLYITGRMKLKYGDLTDSGASQLTDDSEDAVKFIRKHYEETRGAVQTYRYLVSGFDNIPENFVVPSELPWPQYMWGMNLGRRMVGLRNMSRVMVLDDEWLAWLANENRQDQGQRVTPGDRPVMQLRPGERKWRFH